MEENNTNKSVMHIVPLVLGIISIVTALTLGIISIISALFWYIILQTGIVAIVFGVKSSRRTGSKIGKAGMITGIIGLALFAFMYIGMILLLVLANMY